MKAVKVPPVQAPRFTRMNLDVDVRGLGPGEYRRLINGINISPMGLDGLDGVISNIVGTEQVANASLESTSTVLGFLEDPANNRAFFFVLHGGGNHTIYQYNGSAIAIVMRTSLFAFNTASGMIFSATIVGDLLIFSDNTSEIKMINVVKAIAGITYTPTLEQIVLIKRPPQLPLELATGNDAGVSSNYIYGHYFQFYYRYIYGDNEASVFSAISIADRPDPSSETNHNVIAVSIQATESIPVTVKQIDYAVRVDGSNEYVIYRSDLPAVWAISRTHSFYNTELTETLADGVAIKWNDSIPLKSAAVRFFENRLFCLNNTEGYEYPISDIAGAVLTTPSGSGDGRGSKGRGIYPVGLMFFDNYGRHAGVSRIGEVRIPERDYDSTLLRYNIQWNLTAVAQAVIPTWATHYAVVVGECKNIAWFLQHQAADVLQYEMKPDGEEIFANLTGLAKYLAIDITGLSQNNMGYVFTEGDRIIIYGEDNSNVQGKMDLKITKQSGRFLITEKIQSAITSVFGTGVQYESEAFIPVFEIYRAKVSIGEIYNEIGKKYAITNPGGGSRVFSTLIDNFNGDIEKTSSNTYSYEGSTYSDTEPYNNTLEFISSKNFEKMNVYDEHFEKWVRGTGRSIARLSTGSKELLKKNALRFGQEYFLNSSLNQIAAFEALDEQNLPSEGGAGMALAESGRVLVALQYAQTTGIYVGQGFVKTTNGNNFLTKTDNVIGDINKNLGDHGCQNPYTVVCREGRVYYLDLRRGYVIRRSQDGLTRISDYGMRTFFADICRNFRETVAAEFTRIIAGWDPKYECYVIQFQKTADPSAAQLATVYFHEKTNSWVCFATNYPEFYGTFGTRRLDFSGGQLWRQANNIAPFNNWFGNQVYRTLNIEIGADSEEKIWTGIEVDIDTIYTPATPATLLKLLAPNASWTDASVASPAPTLGATTITAPTGSFGQIKAYQALVIPPSAMTRVNYKATISNVTRLTQMVDDPTPGTWTQPGPGPNWADAAGSAEITIDSTTTSAPLYQIVNIPAGSYDAIYVGETILNLGLGGNLTFRFLNNGVLVTDKVIDPLVTVGAINILEPIVFAQAVDSIEIEAQVTALIPGGDIYFRVDQVQIRRSESVTSPVDLPAISTILATSVGVTIHTQSTDIEHPGVGSKDYVISHELANVSVGNSGRLYIQHGALTDPEFFYDIVFTFPVGAVLYQTLSSNEDVIILYHKNDGSYQTKINFRDFRQRASAWVSSFFRYMFDPNFVSETQSKYKSSQKVRGQSAYITINARSTALNPMKSVTVFYEASMLSYP